MTCARCQRGLVGRQETPGEGQVRLRARGLCGGCYATLWKHEKRAARSDRKDPRTILDFERRALTRDEIAEEWRILADRHRTHRENAELIAPRVGTTPAALERTMRRIRQEKRLAS